jgi:WD40 repeat protein
MDHNLRMFDLDKGTLTRTFTGHNDGVTAMAVSLDGKRLISSGVEPNLRWWNTETGDVTNNNGGHGGQVNEIVRSKDGKLLVSVSADKTARVWDVNSTGQQRALEGSTDWVYAAAISPDSKFTAAAGADGVVRVWETANGRLRLMLISWPQEKRPLPEWLAITPEGYYDGSAAWCALLKPSLIGSAPATPQLTAWVKTLRQPDNLLKSWQGIALDAAKPKQNK